MNSLKIQKEKAAKECFDIQVRGPQMREASGICPVCPMVNPVLDWPLPNKILGGVPFKSRVRHVSCRALQSYNSPGDWARELFKPSTHSASLVVEIKKKFFRFRGKCHKWGCFWLLLTGPGPQPIGPLLWLKLLWKLGQNPRL